MGKSSALAKKENGQRGSMSRASEVHPEEKWVKKEKGERTERASLGEEVKRVSRRVDVKTFLKDLESLGFTLTLAKPEFEKDVGRLRARSQDDQAK